MKKLSVTSARYLLFYTLLLGSITHVINIAYSCNPVGPVISSVVINDKQLVFTDDNDYNKYTVIKDYYGNTVFSGYVVKLCNVFDLHQTKFDSRSITISINDIRSNCDTEKKLYGYVAACNVDTNSCPWYGNVFTGEGGWKKYLEGIGQVSGSLKLRCDAPGFCRYRIKMVIPSDNERADCCPSCCGVSIVRSSIEECRITNPDNPSIHNSDLSQATAYILEALIPGDSIYTKIIPVYDGELSTKHLAFYVEDHGLDPNAPNSCDLIASSTSGSPSYTGMILV